MATAIDFHSDPTAGAPQLDSPESVSGMTDAQRNVAGREVIDTALAYLRSHPTLYRMTLTPLVAGMVLALLLVAMTPDLTSYELF